MSSQPHFLVDLSLPRYNALLATKKVVQGFINIKYLHVTFLHNFMVDN